MIRNKNNLFVQKYFQKWYFQGIIQNFTILLHIIRRINSQKMNNKDSSNHIVNNIISYSQNNGDLLSKYNLDFFLNYLDRDAILQMTQYIQPHQHLTVQEFVRIFLLKIDHPDDETLYLALSLKQFYEAILQRTSSTTNYIEFSDFTTYLCEKISKQDLDVVVPPKKLNNQSYCDDNQEINEEIYLEPTIITSKIHQDIPKINKDLPKRNKKLQQKKGVSKFFYSKDMQKIIAVGSLTSSVYIYDSDLTEKRDLKPKIYKEMQKDLAILSIGYSGKNNRIGALLTNGMMVFWQGCDGFTTQKYISTRNCGERIMHLQQLKQWITYDKSTLYFWDLKQESITHTIVCKESAFINDICEINHMKAICISVVTQKQQKFLFIYHQNKRVAKINLQNSGCHTLHYNKLTQALIPLGYHNIIPVYSISGVEFDTEMKFILRGHKSIITCIDSIQSNTLLITGDDLGEIRIWQLAYMRCVQSIKLSKWLGGIRLVGDRLYYSDSRINLMQLDHFQIKTTEKHSPLNQFYDQTTQTLWVITKKDARSINIKKGKVAQIFTLCNEQQQISAATPLVDGFVIGNSKGEIFRYDSDCNLKWHKQAHEGQVKQLQFDKKNRLIFSMGAEGRIVAWPERNTELQQERKSILFRRKQISNMRISQKSNILVVGHNEQKDLTIWDYQTLRLFQVLSMQSPISAIFTSQKLDLVIIATKDMNITFVKFAKKEQQLNLSRIHTFQLQLKQTDKDRDIEMQQIIDLKMISLNEDTKFYLVGSTNKGLVITYDVSAIINCHFVVEYSVAIESVNILRSQKEQFESSFSQRGKYQQIETISNLERQDIRQKFVWKKKITKQGGILLFEIDISENIFGVICQDYTKFVNISNGDIKASLNINETLPIKWNLSVNHFASLKKNIYETLKILDTILKNNGYELLARQYKKINITKFIQEMKVSPNNSTYLTEVSKTPVKEKSYLNKTEIQEPTLKSLEAYKRVKNIKKISEESMYLPIINDSVKSKQSQFDKQQIAEFLMSSYSLFQPTSKRSCVPTERDPYLQNLQTKLCESVLLSNDKKKFKTIKIGQNSQIKRLGNTKTNIFEDFDFRQLETIRKNLATNKENTLKWQKEAQEKSIKKILGTLNSKLKICRQKYIRGIEAEAAKQT